MSSDAQHDAAGAVAEGQPDQFADTVGRGGERRWGREVRPGGEGELHTVRRRLGDLGRSGPIRVDRPAR
jgi:hypothetical protein